MTTVNPWRLPRTQLELHAEHLALGLLRTRPQLIDRCRCELYGRLKASRHEIGLALLERA